MAKLFTNQKLSPLLANDSFKRANSLLELGCGPGTNRPHFGQRTYCGVDINPQAIQVAQANHNGDFRIADITNLPHEGLGQYDAIVIHSVLHHLDDLSVKRVGARLSEFLATNGLIFICDAYRTDELSLSRFFAGIDNGKYIRFWNHWERLLNDVLTIQSLEFFPLTVAGFSLYKMFLLPRFPELEGYNLRRFSLVIPVLNEEESLPALFEQLRDVESRLHDGYFEYIFVDDGSTDRTLPMLREFTREVRAAQILVFSRNFGHQAALFAGLAKVTGEAAIVIDADLQDPPSLIHDLIAAYDEGYHIVATQKESREGGFFLRCCYYLFYRLQRKLSDVEIVLDSGDFGLLSRRVVDILNSLVERNLYLRGLRTWTGFSQKIIRFHRPERLHGRSKYSWTRLLCLASDGLIAFSTLPLRVATVLGLVTIGLSQLFFLYALYVRFVLNASPTGFTAIVILILFSMGVQLFSLGLLGEYIGRIYGEVKRRPRYLILEEIFAGDLLKRGSDDQG